ncbi:MAG: short subunit dehydrogenase-like uncharacterized protein [Bradymonadia bacterium]
MQNNVDLILFGATGFTGRQTADYIASHTAPGELRWAVAGRNAAKLKIVADKARAAGHDVEEIVANSDDSATIDAMVERGRVIVTTAGPFAKYGEPVIAACARLGRDYLDITGETPWARRMIDRYGAQAAESGARVVPFCGFDSVPSDLGAWLAVRALQEAGEEPALVQCLFSAKGGFNGGTLASAFHIAEHEKPRDLAHPFLLDPDPDKRKPLWSEHRDPLKPWRVDALERWAGPFFMAPINSRVVRRSEALFAGYGEGYGEAFAYREGMLASRGLGQVAAWSLAGAQAGFAAALSTPGVSSVVRKLGPKPGEGPSDATMDGGFFRAKVVAKSASGVTAIGEVSGSGDPGNRVTVRILCEAALALLFNRDELPERSGFLTPATAFEDVLVERLRAAGMTLVVSVA